MADEQIRHPGYFIKVPVTSITGRTAAIPLVRKVPFYEVL